MRLWTEYLTHVAPNLPECPELLITDAIRDVAIEFCEHTFCWQDTLSVRVTPTDRDIELTTNDDDIEIVRIMWLGGEFMHAPEPKTPQWLDDNVQNWRYQLGWPEYYTVPLRGKVLWLAPHPLKAVNVDLQVALKPGRDSIEGPDDLYADYREGVQAGAMARLMLIPGKVWFNPQMAMMHNANYMRIRDLAMTRASRGNTKAPIRIKADHRW